MGIKDFWPLVRNASVSIKVADLALDRGFLKNHYQSRALIIGVDARQVKYQVYGFRAADRALPGLHTSDTTLTQLNQLLAQFLKASVAVVFVFDGQERASIKRKRQVLFNEPAHYRLAKELMGHYGFYVHTAKGDADAELAGLNQAGAIDAVYTKDSDLFPFGAQCILRVIDPPKKLDNGTRKKSKDRSDLLVDMYRSETVGKKMQVSRFGLILIALLLPNDFTDGVEGIGGQTALGLAKCGFGDHLVNAYTHYSSDPKQLSPMLSQLNKDMVLELKLNQRGYLSFRSPDRAQKMKVSKFPSLADIPALEAFLTPITNLATLSELPRWTPRIPNIDQIASFCIQHFCWSEEHALKKFHAELWEGIIFQMLSSRFGAYNAKTTELLVPRLQPYFHRDKEGDFVPVLSTKFKTKDPLQKLGKKTLGGKISLTCCTESFVQLTGFSVPVQQSQLSRRVKIPVEIVAVATRCTDKIKGLNGLLGDRPLTTVSVASMASTATHPQISAHAGPSKRKEVSLAVDNEEEEEVGQSLTKRRKNGEHIQYIEISDSD
ncbi:hypothetical protein D9757_005280 [Collybiopsis confluens]|uniref:XPG-I domain-containing protein n=1 Tax=Collybiopsis confluens TaxID=2823264 RepID=A0A8H5HVV3_9AGAR|nr:hypothetical protein D9757_005280 [Collybiopsis confluens]